jgi:hypothetical protein
MTVTALCIEMGALSETFAYELAAALGVRVIDLRPLELGMAEWHLFCNGATEYRGADESPRLHPTASEIEERSVRVAAKIVEAAKGDALIVGWSAAAVLASSFRVARVCIRAPQPMIRASDPKWLKLDDFDLILDSGRTSAAECQREIISLVERRRRREATAALAERSHYNTDLRGPDHGPPSWRPLKGCAVTVGTDDVPLAGIESHEAAIARVERHLRGPNEFSAPANPLCSRALD